MQITLHTDFEKKYRKLPVKLQRQIKERIFHFSQNPSDPQLHNHPLKGKYQSYFSINITGDYRALYKILNETTVVFVDIDTHDKLYS